MYAYNLKPLKIFDTKVPTGNSLCVGTSWVPLNRVIAIHEKLSNLAQIAELSLPSVPEVASNENIYESVEPDEKAVDTDMEVSRLLSDSQMNLPLWDGSHHTSLFKLYTVYCV